MADRGLHEYGTLVLAALARAGVVHEVGVHRVLAVIIEARGWTGLRTMSWGELQGVVVEALTTADRQYNLWQQRGLGYFGRLTLEATPQRHGMADEALADDTLEELVRWIQHPKPPEGCTCDLNAVGLGEHCPVHPLDAPLEQI